MRKVVFLLLSPATSPHSHLEVLAAAARAFQSRELRLRLAESRTPEEALEAIRRSTLGPRDITGRSGGLPFPQARV